VRLNNQDYSSPHTYAYNDAWRENLIDKNLIDRLERLRCAILREGFYSRASLVIFCRDHDPSLTSQQSFSPHDGRERNKVVSVKSSGPTAP
jgi:hypothetical protein